jgi:hypothetical protein
MLNVPSSGKGILCGILHQFQGSFRIICLGSEPDPDAFGTGEDLAHLHDLLVPFRDVGLVYADAVNPQDPLC